MKRIFILSCVLVGVLMLFAYTEVMAGNDCSPPSSPNTCWNFSLGYTITVDSTNFGVIDPVSGKILYRYTINKAKTASSNRLDYAIDSGVQVSPRPPNTYTELLAPCVGDGTTQVGVGDCLRQVAAWTPNFPTGLSSLDLYVETKGRVATLPIAMKGGTGYTVEMGTILGPGIPPLPARTTESKYETDFGTLTCSYSSDGLTFTCKDPSGFTITPIPVKGNVTCTITDPIGGSYLVHVDYMSDGSEAVGSGSPCNIYWRIINNCLTPLAVGTDCIRCGVNGSCPQGKTCQSASGYCL